MYLNRVKTNIFHERFLMHVVINILSFFETVFIQNSRKTNIFALKWQEFMTLKKFLIHHFISPLKVVAESRKKFYFNFTCNRSLQCWNNVIAFRNNATTMCQCCVSLTIKRFHVTSRRPYWCSKTMKWRPCWCTKPDLWELSSFLMQTFSFVQ